MNVFKCMIVVMLAVLFAGCKMPDINVSDKAILIDGYSAVNLIDTGYNPVSGTFTPKITSIISSGCYNSVPLDNDSKDYLHYNARTSSSIWNASVKNSQQMLIFSTSDKELMKKVVDSLSQNINSEK